MCKLLIINSPKNKKNFKFTVFNGLCISQYFFLIFFAYQNKNGVA